jgi:hypothetical protein
MTQRDDTDNRMMEPTEEREQRAGHVGAQATGSMDGARNPAFNEERAADSGMNTNPGQYGTGGDNDGISPATGGGASETNRASHSGNRGDARIGDASVDERDESDVARR